MRDRSWRHGVKRASTCAEGAAKRSPAWESSGCSGARAVGWLQKSARIIFPAPPLPERAMEAASDSANRSTPHDVELARFGRKKCGATARE
jgi:hypothetical protein